MLHYINSLNIYLAFYVWTCSKIKERMQWLMEIQSSTNSVN